MNWGNCWGREKGMGRGRSVSKQPGTRVDEDRTTQKGGIPSKRDSVTKGVIKGSWQGELTRGGNKGLHHMLCIVILYICTMLIKGLCLGYK